MGSTSSALRELAPVTWEAFGRCKNSRFRRIGRSRHQNMAVANVSLRGRLFEDGKILSLANAIERRLKVWYQRPPIGVTRHQQSTQSNFSRSLRRRTGPSALPDHA